MSDDASGLPTEPQSEHFRELDFTDLLTDGYGEGTKLDSWMPTCSGMGGKLPYAKYNQHPAVDYYRPDDDDARTTRHPLHSWSDPSNWSDFETARAQLEMDPELLNLALILQDPDEPYTLSNDPPADHAILIDGDGVIDKETGQPIPEYLAVVELLTGGEPTWQEVSTSQEGAHAVVEGELNGTRAPMYVQLRDEPLDGYDEPPMVEVYAGKHVAALTGKQVAGTPDEWAAVDPDGFDRLREVGTRAHPNVLAAAKLRRGEDYSGASEGGEGDGSSFEVEAVSGLVVDPEDTPEDAPDDLPKCYERALIARYEGDESGLSGHASNLYASMLAAPCGFDVDEATEHFRVFAPGGDVAKYDEAMTRGELERIAAKQEGDGYRAPGLDRLRELGLLDADEMCSDACPIHDALPKPGPTAGFDVRDGGYGHESTENVPGKDEKRRVWHTWTNFQVRLESVITDEDGDTMLRLEVHPAHEPMYVVEVEPTVLNEIRTFKKEVCIGRTTTWQAGNPQLAKLKEWIGRQDAPNKRGTGHMGLHGNLWLTPDGALSADGWVDDADTVYTARGIAAERAWRLSPDDGREAAYDAENVAEMVGLLVNSRSTERFLPVLGWFYASTLRPWILDWEGEFNLLSITGETGSGKTTTNEVLWQLFGMSDDGVSIDQSTAFTLVNALSATNSIPMWFDEYKPSELGEDVHDALHQGVRAATKGGLGTRGNADLSDDGFRMHAPVCITGEESFRGSAEERRGIYTTFLKDSTRSGTATKSAFEKLTGGSETVDGETVRHDGFDYVEHAYAWLRWLLAKDRDTMRERWLECDRQVDAFLAERDIEVTEDLVRQGLQTVVFGSRLLRTFERDMRIEAGLIEPESDDEVEPVVSDQDIEDALTYLSTDGQGAVNRKTHVDTFFEVAGRAAHADYLEEGTHYAFSHKGSSGKEQLRIALSASFDAVRRYARDHDLSLDLFSHAGAYESRIKDEAESIPYVIEHDRWSHVVGKAVSINPEVATETLDGWGRWQFDEDVDTASTSRWVPLNEVVPGGRTSVTVQITRLNRDVHDSKVFEFTAEDETATVDGVRWASSEDEGELPGPDIEEGECYAIRGARVGEYQDAPQLDLDAGVSSIERVERGFEHIEGEEPGPNAQLGDSGSQETAAADGGEADEEYVQLAAHVENAVRDVGPASEDLVAGVIIGSGVTDDRDAIEYELDRLRETGRIVDYGDGYELADSAADSAGD